MEDNFTTKRKRTETNVCVICRKKSCLSELIAPIDFSSWKSLLKSASIRKFEPITSLAHEHEFTVPAIFYYHRNCRATFTSTKSLHKISQSVIIDKENVIEDENTRFVRQSLRRELKFSKYDRTCIFCQKETKYLNKSHSRESLIRACELRVDKKLRTIACERLDERILAITSGDIIAAKAHYHRSCYRGYTRTRPQKLKNSRDPYVQIENEALNTVYEFIRNIFANPRIISMKEIKGIITLYMKAHNVDKVTNSTMTKLRYHIENEFGNSLIFFRVDHLVYMRPDCLSIESLVSDYIKLKHKMEKGYKADDEKLLEDAALFLRSKIKNNFQQQDFPPNPEKLDTTFLSIPQYLIKFLNLLIDGKDNINGLSRVTWSIAQDIIYAISKGKVLTAKHILISWVIKILTGNVELIKIMNRLGHSCSYSVLEEIDTALCIEKLESTENEIALPSNIYNSLPTILAFDNIDRLEEVLSGSGTSHRVNGIIIQPKSQSCEAPKKSSNILKCAKKRTIVQQNIPLPIFTTTNRKSPPILIPGKLSDYSLEQFKEAQRKNLLWFLARQYDNSYENISSWTGFNILLRENVEVIADSIGYLPTINAPATNMSTVQEILRNSLIIKTTLNLNNIAVVMDQALYSKASEIQWSNFENYQEIVIMLGNFHLICNFMSVIGKMFANSGLRDVAIESGVIAPGSIDKVLDGKQYNRAIRFHKIMYEALMKLIWEGFVEWFNVNYPSEIPDFENLLHTLNDLTTTPCQTTAYNALKQNSLKIIVDRFCNYLNLLRTENGNLSKYWMIYIDMVEILLGLIRADREGNWDLHLICIRKVIPWCFAMDKINYARYLPVYYAQMSNLQEKCPDLYNYFSKGGFSVQLGKYNPFARIPVDQTIEETVNKDTQTAGGTRGFSLKPGTISKYYLTAEYRAIALRQMRQIISPTQCTTFSHADLRKPRIKKDIVDVKSIAQLLSQNWINPFDLGPSDIVNLSTGVAASAEVADDLVNAHLKGEIAYQKFQTERLQSGSNFFTVMKKLNLKTVWNRSCKLKSISQEKTRKADQKLFANIVLISENRKLNMQEVFCHPLGPLPWSLSNGDGTMKKTNKCVLAKYLETHVALTENIPNPSATIIDAMGLISKLHGENYTFGELAVVIFAQILNNGAHCHRIDVVFDVYKDQSIKSAERINRGSYDGMVFNNIRSGHKIINWRGILRCNQSKNNFISFLVETWKEEETRLKLREKIMFVTMEEKCFKLTSASCEEINDLFCNHEEADTRLLLHARHAASFYSNIICISDDTDVLVLCLSLQSKLNCHLFIRRGNKNNCRLIDITKLTRALSTTVCTALIGFHAWTGCDTVSSFSGQGKIKAYKLLIKNDEYKQAFSSLGSQWILENETFEIIEKFTCQMYCKNSRYSAVNELRYNIFRAKKGFVESEQLPPCRDTLLQHSNRANYQAGIWRRSLENLPMIPNPSNGHGWFVDNNGNFQIKWMTGPPAPEIVLSLLACKCSRSCQPASCTCIQNKLNCTPACRLADCSNMNREEDEEQDSDEEC